VGAQRPWRRWSTRTRLSIAAGIVIAAVLAVAAVGTVAALKHTLLASVDTTARDDALDVAGKLPQLPAPYAVVAPEPDAVVQVLDAGGAVVGGSANAPARPVVSPEGRRTGRVTVTGTLPLPNTADGYHVAALQASGGRTVLVALPSDDVLDAVHQLSMLLLIGIPVLFLLLVALAWAAFGRALAPVERMYRRQREFVADAAHELRTPLAALSAQLEVDDGNARADVLGHEVARLSDLVDALLALTRAEEHRLTSRDVDLDDVVRDSADRIRRQTDVRVDTHAVSPVRIAGEAPALSRMVDNLLDNAARHAATAVTVSLGTEGTEAVLVVADDGPGVPAADRERVFDRFTRLDDARTRSAGGVGLGLAIVRAVAGAHGGDARVNGEGPGARFVVRIPRR